MACQKRTVGDVVVLGGVIIIILTPFTTSRVILKSLSLVNSQGG